MQTIGERLEDARKKRGISIREAAEATKVRGDYLQKFEGNQFDIGLTDLYVRGFLRNYAAFLKLPADRLLGDYAALGHGEPRPRHPNREVYGRMELSINSAEDRGEPPPPPPPAPPPPEPATRPQPRTPRSPQGLPATPMLDQALIYKSGIAVLIVVVVALAIWGLKELFSGPSSAESSRPPAAVLGVAPAAANSTIAIVALAPAQIKVVRQSDGEQLYQGPIGLNERKVFPNVPLFLTADALENVRIDYKGQLYMSPVNGHNRVQFDFTKK